MLSPHGCGLADARAGTTRRYPHLLRSSICAAKRCLQPQLPQRKVRDEQQSVIGLAERSVKCGIFRFGGVHGLEGS